jgi:ABC-type dipeptide/oligopeptide/nickel transport systems, permease components
LRRALILVRRRAVSAIPVLLIVVVATFLLLEAAPGDAVDAYLLSAGGGDAALAASLRTQYGLDQSLLRALLYIAALGRLDLGWSVAFDRPVIDLIAERLPTTLHLMGSATALSFGLGSLLGVAAGSRPGSVRDRRSPSAR